jgi:hypothetical protein
LPPLMSNVRRHIQHPSMPSPSILQLVSLLVERAPSVSAHLVRTDGVATRSRAHSHLNTLVAGLSSEQREQLAELLQYERDASLHDALVALHEQLVLRGWVVSVEGQALEPEPNGYTLGEEFLAKVAPQ